MLVSRIPQINRINILSHLCVVTYQDFKTSNDFLQSQYLQYLSLPTSILKQDTVFIRINAPGTMHFSKGGGWGGWGVGGGGGTITDKKNQLSSPVAMGDNGHLQP